jgi:hypothetical protein
VAQESAPQGPSVFTVDGNSEARLHVHSPNRQPSDAHDCWVKTNVCVAPQYR